jgi:hypothetical protein
MMSGSERLKIENKGVSLRMRLPDATKTVR